MKELLCAVGPRLSRIVAGAWRWKLESNALEQLVHASLEAGISSFDHADIYGDYTNEERFGAILRGKTSLRDSLQLITKCGIRLVNPSQPDNRVKHYDTSRKHILFSVENSLRRLATDRLDVLLIHRPDPLMDPEEVADTFLLLKEQGKVLYFGVSNFTPAQIELLQKFVPVPLVTNQIEISMFRPQPLFDGTLDSLMKLRIAPMAWSPLGGGKYFTVSGQAEGTELHLKEMAAKYSCTISQILLAWLLRHPCRIFPVLGTTNPDRLKEGAGALALQLERQDWFTLLKLARGSDVP